MPLHLCLVSTCCSDILYVGVGLLVGTWIGQGNRTEVTVVLDDTNVWVNNTSRKRHVTETGVVEGESARKGMKKVQPLLGMLQHLILRKVDDQDGPCQIAQIHAPCQLLPRANSWTILSRMRRWSLYSAAGCAEQLGGQHL